MLEKQFEALREFGIDLEVFADRDVLERAVRFLTLPLLSTVGGGVRIHPENARMSGRHGVQYVAQCVACAALTPVVWQ